MFAGLTSQIITSLISLLAGWLVRHIQQYFKDQKQRAADEAAAKKAVDDLKNAQTPQERDNAAKGVADNL